MPAIIQWMTCDCHCIMRESVGDEWALASAYENKAQCDFGVTSGLLQLSNQLGKNPDFRNFSSYGSPGNFVLTFHLVAGGKSEVLSICLPRHRGPARAEGELRFADLLPTPGLLGLLRHPLLIAIAQVLLGAAIAWALTERWQQWRQRRDFQHRMLVKFSELSFEMMDQLSELLVLRGTLTPDLYAAKRRQHLSRWTAFVSTRGEVMAAYGYDFVLSKAYAGVFNALNALRAHLNASQPVSQDRFEPDQERFLAYREATVAHMVRTMGLLGRRDWKRELAAADARVQAAEERVAALTKPGPASA